MNSINEFSKLDYNILGYLIRKAGNFSGLATVCQLFNKVASEQAESLFAAMEGVFGAPCLGRVLQGKGLSKKSYLAKVDGLFFAAMKDLDPRYGRMHISYGPDSIEQLRRFMRPSFEAEALFKLWGVLRKTGHPALRALMAKVKLGTDYLENIQLFRAFFEANRAEFSKISALNLSRAEFRVFPPEICWYFTQLKNLDLSHNSLTTLPSEIGQLSGLTDLRLNHNCLKSLPPEIGKLGSLQNFQCAFNSLETVPNEICRLQKLRTLNLSCNHLRDLPENIGDLLALNYLYLERNHLSSLPDSIGTIPYLIGLYLFDNEISTLPSNFCQMRELKYLSVQNNALESLPQDIGRMTSLYSLCIDGNKIRELPPSLCSLVNLRHLSLSSNEISGFPPGMDQLNKLDFFNVAQNPIEEFPPSVQSLPFWSLNPQLYPCFQKGRLQTVLNISMMPDEFKEVYWRLSENKWKECIDGFHQHFGKDVYDQGLHGKAVEPGFLGNMELVFHFLSTHPNRIIDTDFYLNVHQIACAHFGGAATGTLIGQEKVGVFRDVGDAIFANFLAPNYLMTDEAMNEFNTLNMKISLLLGSSFRIGDLILKSQSPKSVDIHYFKLSKDQIQIIFNFFLTEFYYDMGHAKEEHFQVEAIAKLIQRLEWLHPVKDGCGRTDTALLNYLLTSYGFNPILLKFPYVSSCKSLKEWTADVIQGMENWREEVYRK